jgi:tRNA-dihydrouridine synthase A
VVYRLKQDFPALTIVLNGGLIDLDQVAEALRQVDGVMIGRAAYENPYLLAEVDRRFFASTAPQKTRIQIIEDFFPYAEAELRMGTPLQAMTRHLLGLFHGVPGARAWRRHLSENAHRRGAGLDVLEAALRHVGPSRTPEVRGDHDGRSCAAKQPAATR